LRQDFFRAVFSAAKGSDHSGKAGDEFPFHGFGRGLSARRLAFGHRRFFFGKRVSDLARVGFLPGVSSHLAVL
jgi:hypothetical protein